MVRPVRLQTDRGGPGGQSKVEYLTRDASSAARQRKQALLDSFIRSAGVEVPPGRPAAALKRCWFGPSPALDSRSV